jgi:hypothetical protein
MLSWTRHDLNRLLHAYISTDLNFLPDDQWLGFSARATQLGMSDEGISEYGYTDEATESTSLDDEEPSRVQAIGWLVATLPGAQLVFSPVFRPPWSVALAVHYCCDGIQLSDRSPRACKRSSATATRLD